MNIYVNRIRKIDKMNATSVFPVCGADEDWDDVMLHKRSRKIEENGQKIWKRN